VAGRLAFIFLFVLMFMGFCLVALVFGCSRDEPVVAKGVVIDRVIPKRAGVIAAQKILNKGAHRERKK